MSAWAADYSSAGDHETRLKNLAEKTQLEKIPHQALLEDVEVISLLQQIAGRLWPLLDSNQEPVAIKVIQEAQPDASTYPNGVICLSTGMLSLTSSEDQLAMIIAHEMVHYARRHGVKAFMLSHKIGPSGDGQNSPAADFPYEQNALAQWRETAEQQADEEGLALIHKAGYCPAEVFPLLAAMKAADERGHGASVTTEVASDQLAHRSTRLRQLVEKGYPTDHCRPSSAALQSYEVHMGPALIADARAAIKRGWWRQAAEDLQKVLETRPDDAQTYFLLGEVESRRGGNSSQAMACFEKAIHINNGFAPAYRALGIMHFKAGEFQQARHYFETSLALAPQDGENEFIRGYLRQCSN
ncbi:MAG: tetratricopeptide repeat protein [Desulfobacteraceae bacterium]|nr:tetratricopeptide repeat protein [Desulfobacteraceae bacterium]